MAEERVIFTKQMKEEYKILLPTMLPMHFKLMAAMMRSYGYHAELLENTGREVVECGLKYVHNDTCYPAILMIGQFISALQSGKYDVNKTALLLTQTGGGCRASNYIPLLRKALKNAGLGQIPVISLNISGLEKNPGFKLTLGFGVRLLFAIYYGDLLMSLVNQCRPYEVEAGAARRMAEGWVEKLGKQMGAGKALSYGTVRKTYAEILRDFSENLPRREEKRPKIGIVGEIFVKFSPLGNNKLEDFLVSEGAETVMAGLLDFLMYSVNTAVTDARLYGMKKFRGKVMKWAYNYLHKKQLDFIRLYKENSTFTPPTDFEETRRKIRGYISEGVQMGEGWLLTAEMLELIESGVENVVCTQPFGCLPNHIVGKGMMKVVREHHKGANLVAIDYDSSASRINQENRLKLMLANANRRLREKETGEISSHDVPHADAADMEKFFGSWEEEHPMDGTESPKTEEAPAELSDAPNAEKTDDSTLTAEAAAGGNTDDIPHMAEANAVETEKNIPAASIGGGFNPCAACGGSCNGMEVHQCPMTTILSALIDAEEKEQEEKEKAKAKTEETEQKSDAL